MQAIQGADLGIASLARSDRQPRPSTTDSCGTAAQTPQAHETAAQTAQPDASLTYRRTERTTLVIETQEGDVVRLNFKTRESLSAEASTGGNGGQPVNEVQINARRSMKLAVFVSGDLSAAELDAIDQVVGQAKALAEDFFGRDTASAFQSAAAFEIDPQQLASVALSMRLREQLGAGYGPQAPLAAAASGLPARRAMSLPIVPASPAAADETSTSATTPAATSSNATAAPGAATSVDEPEAAGIEQSGETELADRAEPATQTPQTAVAGPSSTSPPTVGDFLGIVFDFLAQLIATFDVAEPASTDAAAAQTEATVPLGFSLKLRIFNSIMLSFSEAGPETGTEADPAGSDAANQAAPLLTETVDAMAAGTEPSHEAVA